MMAGDGAASSEMVNAQVNKGTRREMTWDQYAETDTGDYQVGG